MKTRNGVGLEMVKKVQLVIKCANDDVPIAFKTLALQIGKEYEETLEQLLKLEKEHPLEKKMKGRIISVS